MLSHVEHYVPLLSQETDEADFSPSARESKIVSARRRYHATALVASLGLNVALILVTVYLALKQSRSIEWKGARPIYTPAREAVVHELVQFKSLRHVKSRFDGPPSNEVDTAWQELYKTGITAIPKSAAALLPNGTEAYTGDEQHYIVELDVYHQLHCLNLIRKALWPEHYPEVQETRYSTLPGDGGGDFDHFDHCVNAIRESLTCNADLTPVTWHWNERDQISRLDFNAVHTCLNWDALHAWTVENAPRVNFDEHHHVENSFI